MEETKLMLPKVAWPARGGKEIIYRAASPRHPDYLDDIETEIGASPTRCCQLILSA